MQSPLWIIFIPSDSISLNAPWALIAALSLEGQERNLTNDHWCHQQTQTQFASSNDNNHWICSKLFASTVINETFAYKKVKGKVFLMIETKKNDLFFAINISPRHTHSSFRRQVLPGRLKSHAVQISSVTTDGGWNCTRNLTKYE